MLILCQEVRDLGGELGVPGRFRANNRKQPARSKEPHKNLGVLCRRGGKLDLRPRVK